MIAFNPYIMSSQNNKSLKAQLLAVFVDWSSSLKPVYKAILVVFLVVVAAATTVIYVLRDVIITNLKEKPLTEQEIQVQVRNAQAIQEELEAIKKREDAIKAKKAFQARQEMEIEAQRIKFSLQNCAAVNYYSIHNGGSVIDVDGKWVLEVYLSTSQMIEDDFPSSEKSENLERIATGWKWVNNEAIRTNQMVLIEDVTKYPGLYTGRAKEYLQQAGIKAFAIMLVENRGSEFLFVSMNFKEVNPQLTNPDLVTEMYNFRRFVKKRIN